MMTFGYTTLIDLLSWIVVVTLGSKVVATLFVLFVNIQMRDQPGLGSVLWWATKIAPLIAIPCLVWIALLEGDTFLINFYLIMGLIVILAVPLKIWQRRNRISKRTSPSTLCDS